MTDLSTLTTGGASAPCDPNSPLMVAWEQFRKSESFANSRKWAAYPEHVEGSLWNLFMTGFQAAQATVPTPVYKAVERVLDEHSAWIAAPNPELVRKIALAATFAAHAAIVASNEQTE